MSSFTSDIVMAGICKKEAFVTVPTCRRLHLFFLNEIGLYTGSGEFRRKQLAYSEENLSFD